MEFIVIIVMEICKAPTLRFKALNKHSITHRDGNVISNKNVHKEKKEKKLTHNTCESVIPSSLAGCAIRRFT